MPTATTPAKTETISLRYASIAGRPGLLRATGRVAFVAIGTPATGLICSTIVSDSAAADADAWMIERGMTRC